MYSNEVLSRNIKVFSETQEYVRKHLKAETLALRGRTKLYDNPERLGLCRVVPQNISFVSGGTISVARDLVKEDYRKVAILNFADGITPGGLVMQGFPTQEEDLCRCSNLYDSLTVQNNLLNFYAANEKEGKYIFLEKHIYSPSVTFFRDEDYNILPESEHFKLDVISSPAPVYSGDSNYDVFLTRVRGILKVALDNDVDAIVLGAWGTGAFGNPVVEVAKAFARILSEYHFFEKVVFAIKPTEGDDDMEKIDEFKEAFFDEYLGA